MVKENPMSIWSAVPWSVLLKQAPALVKAADALLSGTLVQRTHRIENLKRRVEALEAHDRQDAALMKSLAEELQALTVNARILASRVKLALWLSGLGFLLGLGAMVLVVFLR
jgi:hypothetical protein